MFALRRDGPALALRLLDLVEDGDIAVRSRIGPWLSEVLRILPPVVTGDAEIDRLHQDCVLIALVRKAGWRGDGVEPSTASDLLLATGLVEERYDDMLAKFRAALRSASGGVTGTDASGGGVESVRERRVVDG